MKSPFRENAYVPGEKLIDYLLSHTHPVGQSKARFFAALGFDATKAGILEQQLIAIAQSEDISTTTVSPYGTKYVIRGTLQAIDGRTAQIETVWIIETDQEQPRLVTAYPA